MPEISRRVFAASAGSITAASAHRVLAPAVQPVRLGFVGVGNRGMQLLTTVLTIPEFSVTALCDVYEPHLSKASAAVTPAAACISDYRRLLERRDVDAVVIATPDHWHALQTIHACEAGKDVYVEKPLSVTVVEGRRMVAAARRTKRLVQVGLQRRSSAMYADLARQIQGGHIGKVTVAKCFRVSNMYPSGIGRAPDGPPPNGLDWDMWLGPRPSRPFNPNIAPYKFRWWRAYSSQVGNWGVHYFDVLRWMLGENAPVSVSAHGGRYAVDDSRDIPDTMEAIFEFASGRLMTFGQYEASGVAAPPSGEVELRGTLGTLFAGGAGYEIVPDKGGQFQDWKARIPAAKARGDRSDIVADHLRDFAACIRTRERPKCDVEEGHRSTTFAHLANISLALRSRIEWDAVHECITSPRAANAHLHYKYRAPWVLPG